MLSKVGKTVKKQGVTRRFDWRPSTHTEQNRLHRLASLDCFAVGKAREQIKRSMFLNLDQGSEGACTGFGAAHVLASTPSGQKDITNEVAQQIYHQARREDEWAGEDYDGSSVNGAMHAARTLGRISSWRWITTQGELLHALSYHGSVEVGSQWFEGMWEPDENGFLHAVGKVIGGHAYCVSGYRRTPFNQSLEYWIDNSWGSNWGLDGGAWLAAVDAHKLWFIGGEVALPKKVT